MVPGHLPLVTIPLVPPPRAAGHQPEHDHSFDALAVSPDRLDDDTQLATELPLASTEAELLSQTARGNADAFALLYDATCSKVHGLVLRVLRDQAQAEEVTQEVFLEV